ncbi:MAG: ParB/RepB/Spo0J family partition protein [Clostridia bacterium]|nr:ParB/RepB/Spo0J family partition protein [Clostridia bacterium]
MAKAKLGRGLGSLFDEPSIAENTDAVESLRITLVEPNKNQPRHSFDKDKIDELSESIKEHGVIQPIIVVKNDDRYKIVAGERRWRAAKKAGLKEIPAVIRNYSEFEIAQIALIENLQRENLNPIEEALGYQTLMSKFNMTQEDVSDKIGKSRSAIANSVRLLSLDEPIRQKLISGDISSGHARALLSIESPKVRLAVLESIIEKGLNVRQAEALAKQLQKAKPNRKKPTIDEQVKAQIAILEDRLSSRLGTKVTLHHDNKKGKIEIEYYGNADLDRIISLIEEA